VDAWSSSSDDILVLLIAGSSHGILVLLMAGISADVLNTSELVLVLDDNGGPTNPKT
jgi:hypothetical protein